MFEISSAALEEHRDYLDSLYAACTPRPRIHAHQLIALERERALCAGAVDLESYLAASAGCFELTRSAWLDRLANQVRVAALLDDRWTARAVLSEYAHAQGANGSADWVECLVRGAAEAAPYRRRAAECGAGLSRTLAGLINWRTTEPCADQDLRDARSSYLSLLAAQPDFSLAALQDRPFFRQRIPWSDAVLPMLYNWMEGLGDRCEAALLPPAADDPLDELERLQSRWRWSLGSAVGGPAAGTTGSRETLLAGYQDLAAGEAGALSSAAKDLMNAAFDASSPTAALARLVRGGHLARVTAASLRGRADAALARQDLWPDPIVAHHWRSLLATLEQARTPTEVDLIVAHGEACFAVESDWNRLWMAAALAPFRAALSFSLTGAGVHAGVEKAVALCEQLMGCGPRNLLSSPHLAAFFSSNLSRFAIEAVAPPGAWLGEAGFDLILPMRAWAAKAMARGEPARPTPEKVVLEAGNLLERAGAREPQTDSQRCIQLWGKRASTQDCAELVRSPARPPIPGFH